MVEGRGVRKAVTNNENEYEQGIGEINNFININYLP